MDSKNLKRIKIGILILLTCTTFFIHPEYKIFSKRSLLIIRALPIFTHKASGRIGGHYFQKWSPSVGQCNITSNSIEFFLTHQAHAEALVNGQKRIGQKRTEESAHGQIHIGQKRTRTKAHRDKSALDKCAPGHLPTTAKNCHAET